MLSDLRLKASGSGKPSGLTSFTPSNLIVAADDLPKSVTTSEVSSKRPVLTATFTFLIVTLSMTTFVSLGSFSSFFSFGPSFLLTAAMMRSKLFEPAASNT